MYCWWVCWWSASLIPADFRQLLRIKTLSLRAPFFLSSLSFWRECGILWGTKHLSEKCPNQCLRTPVTRLRRTFLASIANLCSRFTAASLWSVSTVFDRLFCSGATEQLSQTSQPTKVNKGFVEFPRHTVRVKDTKQGRSGQRQDSRTGRKHSTCNRGWVGTGLTESRGAHKTEQQEPIRQTHQRIRMVPRPRVREDPPSPTQEANRKPFGNHSMRRQQTLTPPTRRTQPRKDQTGPQDFQREERDKPHHADRKSKNRRRPGQRPRETARTWPKAVGFIMIRG